MYTAHNVQWPLTNAFYHSEALAEFDGYNIYHFTLIHSFISGMHHYECVAPNIDINLQSGWFWATSIASFRKRLNDSRSCWIVLIHVVWGRPGGLLQFSRSCQDLLFFRPHITKYKSYKRTIRVTHHVVLMSYNNNSDTPCCVNEL